MYYKTARENRKIAWEQLRGSYWNVFVNIFIMTMIVNGIAGVTFGIALLIIMGPVSIGMIITSLNVIRGKNYNDIGLIFDGFQNNLSRNILLGLFQIFKVFLWSLLFIIPGIIKSYAYSQAFFIAIDYPELTADEVLKKSEEMMKGHKWRLFCLKFSFIGWILLSLFTFGVGMFFLTPYQIQANAVFYEELKENQTPEILSYAVFE